jgi:hypothetical protein
MSLFFTLLGISSFHESFFKKSYGLCQSYTGYDDTISREETDVGAMDVSCSSTVLKVEASECSPQQDDYDLSESPLLPSPLSFHEDLLQEPQSPFSLKDYVIMPVKEEEDAPLKISKH